MSDALLIFTFSPVQSFITEARRASDLYVGSQILVHLAKAAGSVLKQRGTLIYPAELSDDVPNKLVARVAWEDTEKTVTKKKSPKQPPLWLRRLDLVKAELKTVRFPKTAAEGFRQCAMLSETARRWFLDSIRQEHPGWNEEQIEQERQLLLARFSAAEAQRLVKWKEDRGRYFRG